MSTSAPPALAACEPHARLADAVLRPVRAHHAFEACVERLGTAIRLGLYPQGSALPPERELATRLSVSRATLREAIAALRDAGLVATRRGRGGGTVVTSDASLVTPPKVATTPQQRRDWLDALAYRRVVEGGAAHQAASRTLDDHERAILQDAHDAVANAHERVTHRQADSRFHLTLATLAGSSRIAEAVASAQAALNEMLTAIPVLALNIEHSDRQHERITKAVLAGNSALAQRVMWEHCDDTAGVLRGLIP